MRILAGPADPVDPVVESFRSPAADGPLQVHVIDALLGSLGTGEVARLGIGEIANTTGESRAPGAGPCRHSSFETIVVQ